MKASEWIDRVKKANGWDSDYRVAKELGLSRQTVSTYRGAPNTMDEDTAIKVAAALGERPEIVLIDQAVERSKNDAARTALSAALKRLGGVAAGLVVAVGVVSGPSQAEARTASPSPAQSADSLYIMSNLKDRDSPLGLHPECRTKLWLPTCPPNPANDFKLALPTTQLSKHPTSEFERGPS